MSNILVVEDEPIILESLTRLLERQGYLVTGVCSVAEAEEHSINQYDLIISDLRLPGEPGTSLITRAVPVPVLIMTSSTELLLLLDKRDLDAIALGPELGLERQGLDPRPHLRREVHSTRERIRIVPAMKPQLPA